MRTYGLATFVLAAFFLGLFALAEAFELPLLIDPEPWLSPSHRLLAATVGVGLLVGDVVLPVPSSLVMIGHGAIFGAFWGTLISLGGSLGGAAVAFGLGRLGGPILARVAGETQRRRAMALLDRWGDLAVVLSRPVPILAETLAILAGTSPMTWPRFLLAALTGALPASLIYALAGAYAVHSTSFVLIFFAVLVLTGIFWWVGRRRPAQGS